jgi:antitoxin YefM
MEGIDRILYMYGHWHMKTMTYTQARQNLAATMDRVCEDCASVAITRTRKQQEVVMLSRQEYDQLEETAYLLRSPANAKRLLHAMEELSRGKGKARKLRLG